MARKFNGTSDKGVLSAAAVTALPLTIAGWFNISATGAQRVITELSDGTTSNLFKLAIGAGAKVQATQNASGPATGTSVTAGKWQHACAVFAGTTSRSAYLNGGSKATDVTSVTTTGINKTTIGCSGAGTLFFNGSLADIAIWKVALTDSEVVNLAAGYSPLKVRPGALVAYYPLPGQSAPELDLVAAKSIAMTGTIAAAQPPLVRAAPLNRLLWPAWYVPDTLFAQAWM